MFRTLATLAAHLVDALPFAAFGPIRDALADPDGRPVPDPLAAATLARPTAERRARRAALAARIAVTTDRARRQSDSVASLRALAGTGPAWSTAADRRRARRAAALVGYTNRPR